MTFRPATSDSIRVGSMLVLRNILGMYDLTGRARSFYPDPHPSLDGMFTFVVVGDLPSPHLGLPDRKCMLWLHDSRLYVVFPDVLDRFDQVT